MLAGQLIAGGAMSLTVTVKLHIAVLPPPSVAVQVTVVVPFGKDEPDCGVHITNGDSVQMSVAVALYVATA